MKVLDAGTENLSNMDVMNWIAAKKAQHAEEDAADKKNKQKFKPRPKKFLKALDRHHRELNSSKYPYARNPNVYDGTYTAMEKFDMLLTERLCTPLEAKYIDLLTSMDKDECMKRMEAEQEAKGLTPTEHLMLFNLAPAGVEQLQTMLENCEERFSAEEQQVILDCILEVYRADEPKKTDGDEEDAVMNGTEAGFSADATGGAKEDAVMNGAEAGSDADVTGRVKEEHEVHAYSGNRGSLSPWSKRTLPMDIDSVYRPGDNENLGPSRISRPYPSTAKKANAEPLGRANRLLEHDDIDVDMMD
ncbi:hypothetical protein LTR62_001441 [Meristemomyces frigidus]|uniref:DNA-directed RNA polymerase III subunit RPC9 n=1 Tax=Meristemomyces frigidus TaxID=1508187 RepID=A0AAN7TGG7_9PEZI|nr:hypothetical protein LTR62_001441 [Meristemomyces frigidus]